MEAETLCLMLENQSFGFFTKFFFAHQPGRFA
jgi:hypothetical protein